MTVSIESICGLQDNGAPVYDYFRSQVTHSQELDAMQLAIIAAVEELAVC